MDQSTAQNSDNHCPQCAAALVPNAVLCVNCGYHLEKKTFLAKAIESPKSTAADEKNPYRSPEIAASKHAAHHPILGFFWIRGRVSRLHWWLVQFGYFMFCVLAGAALKEQFVPEWIVVPMFWCGVWLLFVSQVKRWHDMDKSGFWCLINLIPVLGVLYAVIELGFQKGTTGANEYGPEPVTGKIQPESGFP
jgi:uncharacterized membrane protein YhaH (DUF805 family)